MGTSMAVNREGYSSVYLSEAVVHNGIIYCSGKVGLDATTGELVSDDAGQQTGAALTLIESVLRAAGSDLGKLLKVNISLTSRADFEAMNAVYVQRIPDPKPARACVTVTELGKGAKVEIEATAYIENPALGL
ncbi:Endoribonuclease L-PSP [Sarocladium strictum]